MSSRGLGRSRDGWRGDQTRRGGGRVHCSIYSERQKLADNKSTSDGRSSVDFMVCLRERTPTTVVQGASSDAGRARLARGQSALSWRSTRRNTC